MKLIKRGEKLDRTWAGHCRVCGSEFQDTETNVKKGKVESCPREGYSYAHRDSFIRAAESLQRKTMNTEQIRPGGGKMKTGYVYIALVLLAVITVLLSKEDGKPTMPDCCRKCPFCNPSPKGKQQ